MKQTSMYRIGLSTAILFMFLLVGLTGVVQAKTEAEPGGVPEGYRLSGPAIVGTLTLLPNPLDEGTVIASGSGTCKGKTYILEPMEFITWVYFEDITAADMEGYHISSWGPAGCRSETGGEDIVINTITKFSNTGSMITAEGILLFLIQK